MSLALIPKASDQMGNFMRALQRFQKEDPTFRVGSYYSCFEGEG
jgi:elongation factor G